MGRTIVRLLILLAALWSPMVFASSSSVSQASTTVYGYPNYRIATIVVTFSDHPATPSIEGTTKPWTKAYLDGFLFSNSDSMAAFYETISGGRMSVTGDVYDNGGGWYELPRPATIGGECDWQTYFRNAVDAADPDIDYDAYNTILILAPELACSPGGKAWSVEMPNLPAGDRYRVLEADGRLDFTPQHEFGHIIGMDHANVWTCDPPGILTGTNCTLEEYGDRFSVMGLSRARMLTPAAPHMENLGWVESTDIVTVTADGDYVIRPVEIDGTLPRYLKLPQARDANGAVTSWYYLEYRQAIGFDHIPLTPTIQELGVPNGALVHIGSDTSRYITTTLLDMTPGSRPGADMFDPALPLGSSYTDPVAGVGFGILQRTASSMTIRVRFGVTTLCERRAPTVSVKPARVKGQRGTTIITKLTVTNASVLCGTQALEIRTTKAPRGWSVTTNKKKTYSVTLASGASKRLTVRATSSATAKVAASTVTLEARLKNAKTYKKATAFRVTLTR